MGTLKTSSRPEAWPKDLLTLLILQDMRHHQLISLLAKAGLDHDLHDLQIMEIVTEMMGITETSPLRDQWGELYYTFLERSTGYEITKLGRTLETLAGECYETLVACAEMAGKLKSRSIE